MPTTTPEPTGQPAPEEALTYLLELLELEPLEVNLFRGSNPEAWAAGRVFGGLVAAQGLRAAINTVEAPHLVHSFHSYFIRPGQMGPPIIYSVDRIRDGRSFTTRRVTAIQHGAAIFVMDASFHRDGEEGIDYQLPVASDAPGPDSPVGLSASAGPFGAGMPRPPMFLPFEMRELGPTEPEADGTYRSTRRVWIRTRAPLPADPSVHACVLTFVSDLAVILAVRPPSAGSGMDGFMGASLDHAVWFHRAVRVDDWLLYDLHAVSNFNARGLARGLLHDRSGRLVASMTQECLIRTAAPAPGTSA
ncbi:MAG: thioesterase family protein [Acidimicrobiales bacterium]|nr:thioesterase family protein [Acidimicrobiales bacterium]